MLHKISDSLRAKGKNMGDLAGTDIPDTWQKCGVAREKVSIAGYCFYPGFTCLKEEEGEKGSMRG